MIWLTSLTQFTLTDKHMFILDTGIIYQLGRDLAYRPNVILNLSKLPGIRENQRELKEAMMYLLILVREIMCLPFHVERWNLIIDSSATAFANGQLEFLEELQDLIRTNFPRTIEWVFMFNSRVTEELSHKFHPFPAGYDRRRRIFVTNKFDKTLSNYISPDQLERRFGGNIDDLAIDDCFPPLATAFVRTGINPLALIDSKLYYFKMTPYDMFSNILVQQTSTGPNPLRIRQAIEFNSERPRHRRMLGLS